LSANFTYNKTEKLKSRKELELVFKGKSFLVFPLKIFFYFSDIDSADLIKCGVGASKKNFSKAVDRNRVKRLLREAYRLNKAELHSNITNKKICFFVLYIDKNMPESFAVINEKMKLAIEKLNKRYLDEVAIKTV
jgi:ribonuclease P protein component